MRSLFYSLLTRHPIVSCTYNTTNVFVLTCTNQNCVNSAVLLGKWGQNEWYNCVVRVRTSEALVASKTLLLKKNTIRESPILMANCLVLAGWIIQRIMRFLSLFFRGKKERNGFYLILAHTRVRWCTNVNGGRPGFSNNNIFPTWMELLWSIATSEPSLWLQENFLFYNGEK